MKTYLLPLALLLGCASSIAGALAASPIVIDKPHSHPTAAPGVPGVGFMALTNTGQKPDRLLSVSSPLAGRIEIHQSSVEAGVMKMRAVSQGVPLPVGKAVAFAPGGLHLMLFALHEPLREGARVPVTLTFERAGSVSTELQVQAREVPPPEPVEEDHSQHSHHSH